MPVCTKVSPERRAALRAQAGWFLPLVVRRVFTVALRGLTRPAPALVNVNRALKVLTVLSPAPSHRSSARVVQLASPRRWKAPYLVRAAPRGNINPARARPHVLLARPGPTTVKSEACHRPNAFFARLDSFQQVLLNIAARVTQANFVEIASRVSIVRQGTTPFRPWPTSANPARRARTH